MYCNRFTICAERVKVVATNEDWFIERFFGQNRFLHIIGEEKRMANHLPLDIHSLMG
jgi:hypothetical protein